MEGENDKEIMELWKKGGRGGGREGGEAVSDLHSIPVWTDGSWCLGSTDDPPDHFSSCSSCHDNTLQIYMYRTALLITRCQQHIT